MTFGTYMFSDVALDFLRCIVTFDVFVCRNEQCQTKILSLVEGSSSI